MEISIDWISVETGIWHIQRCLIQKHGTHVASIDIEPLVWYIKTGRASADFLRALLEAKPFMVARKLHEGGSYDEVLKRVKMYIGWEEEA